MANDEVRTDEGNHPHTIDHSMAAAPKKEFLLQFFEYGHLPDRLKEISAPFGELANIVVERLPANPERTTALRKLLEAKDCAVRAMIAK